MNIKKTSILLILTLIFTIQAYGQQLTREQYIARYKNIAISKMHSHGIPASITLAQGCLESGNGNSKLAVDGRNHFGIKCHDWQGATIKIDDDLKNECFRKYNRVEESYDDHGDFLKYRPRYAFLFNLEVTDYKGWAYGLKQAGYATNPQYPRLLIKIIEENQLYQYDRGREFTASKTTPIPPSPSRPGPIPPSPSKTNSLKVYHASTFCALYKLSKIRKIYTLNQVPYIIAKQGDTYNSIAKDSDLYIRDVLKYNDLDKETNVTSGSKVFLEKKRTKAPRENRIHIAKEGDTYYNIAQEYGIRLIKIYRYNDIQSYKTRPDSGEEIFLRNHKNYYW